MNNRGQWNMNQYCINNQRNRMQQRNKYQHTRFQDFSPNFSRPWNSSVMGFEPDRYKAEFRPKRGMNRQHFRMINSNGNNNMRRRRQYGDTMSQRNSWVLEEENCFEEPDQINFAPVHQDRKAFHRETSLPPVVMRNRINEPRKPEFFDNRSLPQPSVKPFKSVRPETSMSKNLEDEFSPSSFKRTVRTDSKSDQMHMTWSDSESDSKDVSWVDSESEHKSEKETEMLKVVHKDEQNLISMIWTDESDEEDCCVKNNEISSTQKGRCPFKYTAKSIPRYDGKNITGDEGVFEIKVFHCTFCNILCMDKDKSKAHMLTKYHYKRYKKELEKYDEDIESENANEE